MTAEGEAVKVSRSDDSALGDPLPDPTDSSAPPEHRRVMVTSGTLWHSG